MLTPPAPVWAVRLMLLLLNMSAERSGLNTAAAWYMDSSTTALGCGDGIVF